MEDGVEEEIYAPSLEELLNTDTLKWIFVGGKGGVGKTTTSCSIAVALSKKRENVLILSTDPAHNLSDALMQKFPATPTLVNGFENLYAMEIDTTVHETSQFKLEDDDASGFSKLIPELMSSFPGIDEALSFAEMMSSVQTMKYSAIVFDTAPTGHTLRLLCFPDLLDKALKKLVTLRDKMSGALNMVHLVSGQSVNEDEIYSRFDSLMAVTSSVRESFQDPSKTTFVCVCIPEFLSVYETERLVQELAKQGIDCSNIVVNQVLFPLCEAERLSIETIPAFLDAPSEANGAVSQTPLIEENRKLREAAKLLLKKVSILENSHLARRRMQSKYLTQIQDLYAGDFHVVCMPLQDEEVRGVDKLQKFAKLLSQPMEMPLVQ